MKNNIILAFLFILLQQAAISQCPQVANITAAGKCIRLVWSTPPSPLPAYIIYNGVTFNYNNGAGTGASPAEYRDPSATGACSSYNPHNSTLTLPNGQLCTYAGGVLPLHWLNVSGSLNSSKQAVLNFKVTETNVAKYEIEKSADGSTFATIATISSKGNGENTYQFTDAAYLQGTGYYRIKQVDNDGRYTYSNIIFISKDSNSMFSIYPNPVKDRVTITVGNRQLLNTTARLYSADGMLQKIIVIQNSQQQLDMQHLSSGIYILKFDDATALRIVKE